MSSRPTTSEDDGQAALELSALDELSQLIDRISRQGQPISEAEFDALKNDLNGKLNEMVEKTLREHLQKKNEK